MSIGIIVKKYEHVNSSFGNWNTPKGKYISSKKQYDEEMKKGGYVPFEQAQKMVDDKNKRKPYGNFSDLSPKAKAIISSVKQQTKKNFKLSDRAIDAMKELGVKFDRQNKSIERGGFDATN